MKNDKNKTKRKQIYFIFFIAVYPCFCQYGAVEKNQHGGRTNKISNEEN